jgi:hypothetical protein
LSFGIRKRLFKLNNLSFSDALVCHCLLLNGWRSAECSSLFDPLQ